MATSSCLKSTYFQHLLLFSLISRQNDGPMIEIFWFLSFHRRSLVSLQQNTKSRNYAWTYRNLWNFPRIFPRFNGLLEFWNTSSASLHYNTIFLISVSRQFRANFLKILKQILVDLGHFKGLKLKSKSINIVIIFHTMTSIFELKFKFAGIFHEFYWNIKFSRVFSI